MRLNKIVVLIILMFILMVIFGGCGDNKPDDIRQEIWDEVKNRFLLLDKKMQQGEKLEANDFKQLTLFITKYNIEDLTISEKAILLAISKMAIAKYNIDYNKSTEADYKDYNFYKDKLKEIYNIK
jgi:hypothetical protein